MQYYMLPREGRDDMRPIGLLPSLVRVWERYRRPYAKEWETRNHRDRHWACSGRAASQAVWLQVALDELASASQQLTVTILLDLEKAFEYVRHIDVWSAGLATGMPKRLLRMVLRIYSATRRVVLDKCASRATAPGGAIIPGSVFAVLCLKMVLLEDLDQLPPEVVMTEYVDDLTGKLQGDCPTQVVQSALGLIDAMASALQRRRLKVSVGKTVYMCSPGLRDALAKPMEQRGLKEVDAAKLLGADYSLRRRALGVRRTRLAKVGARRPKVQHLRRAKGGSNESHEARVAPSHVVRLRCLWCANAIGQRAPPTGVRSGHRRQRRQVPHANVGLGPDRSAHCVQRGAPSCMGQGDLEEAAA